jgi:hypothetical protein
MHIVAYFLFLQLPEKINLISQNILLNLNLQSLVFALSIC